MNVQFVNTWLLFLLWLAPLAVLWWYFAYRRQERAVGAFLSSAMQRKLRPAGSGARFLWQAGLLGTALALLLVAAARPQWGEREVTVFRRGRDVVIALDVSRSMLAEDVHPNRLARARADLMDLVSELRGDRAALLAFRKRAVMLCPLTTDYAYLRQALDAAGVSSAARGETDVGNAIERALEVFENRESSHKAIVLVSDGDDLAGRALEAAKAAGERGIPIFTVGLGGRAETRIPVSDGGDGFATYKGEPVTTRLHDDTLLSIARSTGGAYVPLGTSSTAETTLGELYRRHLRKIAAQDLEETLQRRYVERYQWFLAPGLLCLLAAAALSRGRLDPAGGRERRPCRPSSRGAPLKDLSPPPAPLRDVSAVLLLAALPAVAFGATNEPARGSGTDTQAVAAAQDAPPIDVPPGRAGARAAQEYYRRGDYERAAAAYRQAAGGATRSSQDTFLFNAAAALYRAGRHEEAAALLAPLVEADTLDRHRTALALGSALFRAAEQAAEAPAENDAEDLAARARNLKEAGEAFKRAGRAQPGDDVARRNLAIVLEALPEAQREARIAELLARHGHTPPEKLAQKVLREQRRLLEEIPAAFTNDSPGQIAQLEALAARQRENAELWIPLKQKMLQAAGAQAGSPQGVPSAQEIEACVESVRDAMHASASNLRDLAPAGFRDAVAAENGTYQLWKGVAPYSQLLSEDLLRQTNSMRSLLDPAALPAGAGPLAEQREAARLTRLFSRRFAQSIPEGGIAPSPPAGTNLAEAAQGPAAQTGPPPISAEERAAILELAEKAAGIQDLAAAEVERRSPGAIDRQRQAYALLKEIEERLPRRQQATRPQPREQEPEQQPPPQQQPPPSQQQPPQPAQQQEGQPERSPEPPRDQTPEEVRQLLQRALMNEREREAEKRRRHEHSPLPPLGRDW